MRVLLDEHVPQRLARELVGNSVSTVKREGWTGRKNGALLKLAEEAGFEVLLTNDRSIEHQQNLSKLRLAIVVLDAPTNQFHDLVPLVPQALEAIAAVGPGEVCHLAR